MKKSQIFFALAVSFIVGVAIRSLSEADFLSGEYFLSVIAIILGTVFYRQPKVVVFAFALLFCVLGIWRTDQALQKVGTASQDNREFSGRVTIQREPENKDTFQKIVAEINEGEGSGNKIIFNVNQHADLHYGDVLQINCLLRIPENKDEEFDYRMYLAKEGVFYECQNLKFERTGENVGRWVYVKLLAIKNKLARNIAEVMPQPEGALASGLIFGGSADLPKSVSNNFSRTGMTHIVAVSGYNVTVVAEYLMLFGIFLGLWRKQAFWFAILGIVLFVAMTGAPSSAVRAGVMGVLILWAMKHGRLANSRNAILFAAAVMLMINPMLLRWDIGFQLSFLATIGIVAISPLLDAQVIKKYNPLGMTEIILLSLSAQVFVVPIIMINFHTLSVISLVANALVLPLVPVSMLLVFLTSLAGLLSQTLSLPLAWLAYVFLKYEISVITWLGSWQWSSITIGKFDWWLAVGWYGILSALIYFAKIRKRRTMQVAHIASL